MGTLGSGMTGLGSVPTGAQPAGGGGTVLNVYQAIAQANTDTLLISAINGDHAKTFRIWGAFTISNAGSIKIQPNGADTNAMCQAGGYQAGGSSFATAIFLGAQASGAANVWQATDVGIFNGIIHAATAQGSRAFDIRALHIRAGVPLDQRWTQGGWIDSTTVLTSLKLLGGVANLFQAGSQFFLAELGA